MNREEFKEKYLTNSFYWVNQHNHQTLQLIFKEFDIHCHMGVDKEMLITWHDTFKNLVTFPKDQWHNFEYYQKSDMWIPNIRYGEPKNYSEMIYEYNLL